jgi:hypothetical protein
MKSYPQCCSPGNPTGGTVNQGTLEKKSWRTILFYQYGYSKSYFTGTSESGGGVLENAAFNYIGGTVAYGITPRFTAEWSGGYYINRKQLYKFIPPPDNKLSGNGFSDFIIQGKYSWIKSETKQFELTTGAGLQIPTHSNPQEKNGVVLPQDIQPASNAFGLTGSLFLHKGFIQKKTHLFFVSQYLLAGKNDLNYKRGDAWINSFFVSYNVKYPWSIIMRIRNELSGKDHRSEQLINASGSNLLYLSPQINYNIKQKLDVSVLFDVPVYRYYNGTQLAKQYNVAVIVSKIFKPVKKEFKNKKVE